MRSAITALILGSALGCFSALAAPVDPWKMWLTDLHNQCPSKHVDWVMDGGYDELIGDFVSTIPKSTQLKAVAIADYSRRCASETAGFSCEMGAYLDAFNRLGLLRRFAAFGCRTRSCSEPALCIQKSN